MSSPTPRTDAVTIKRHDRHIVEADELVFADFASTLERELAQLREALFYCSQHSLDLIGAWSWKKDEPRAGNKAEYDEVHKWAQQAQTILGDYLPPPAGVLPKEKP